MLLELDHMDHMDHISLVTEVGEDQGAPIGRGRLPFLPKIVPEGLVEPLLAPGALSWTQMSVSMRTCDLCLLK